MLTQASARRPENLNIEQALGAYSRPKESAYPSFGSGTLRLLRRVAEIRRDFPLLYNLLRIQPGNRLIDPAYNE